MARLARWVVVAALMTAAIGGARATDADLVSIATPRDVKQAFILIKPSNPVASVMLFAGGHGALGLTGSSAMRWGTGNFLVRSRQMFAAEGFMVAVIDAPSDRQHGMNAIFRMSGAHAGDIGAVAAYLKKLKAVPVWLVGTSMGTFSAADGAIAGQNIAGLVLTSTVTRSKPNWNIAQSHRDGVASMPLSRIAVPTLIVSHRHDGCEVSPAADAPKLKARLSHAKVTEIALLDGGTPPRSKPCQAKSQHGYFGIEAKAVATIARFIKSNRR